MTKEIIVKHFPDAIEVIGPAKYKDLDLYSVTHDGLGGDLDTIYSVDSNGKLSGFPITQDLLGVAEAFEEMNRVEHTYYTGEEYLSHYGVPGMKWGKRKSPSKRERKKRVENDLKNLSDKQLQERLNRMRNEDAYRQMSGVGTKTRFRESVENKIREGASQAVTSGVTTIMTAGATAVTIYAAKKIAGSDKQAMANGASWVASTLTKKK